MAVDTVVSRLPWVATEGVRDGPVRDSPLLLCREGGAAHSHSWAHHHHYHDVVVVHHYPGVGVE